MRTSSRRILSSSHNSALSSMVEREMPDKDYSNGIPVATVVDADWRSQHSEDDIINLDFSPTTKIGLFGPSGSGKTIFGKAMVSRLSETGRAIYSGGDVKNDFQYMDKYGGVSKELQQKMGLLDNEKPREIPTKLFAPKPVLDAWGKNPSYVEPFTFGFQDLSRQDLKFLLGQGDLSASQENILTEVFSTVDLNDTGFDELIDEVDEVDDAHSQSQTALRATLKSLREEKIVSNEFRMDPVKHLDQGYSVALALRGYSNFSNGGMHKVQFYASLMFRRLMNRVMDGEIETPLCGLWAEFHRLAPSHQNSLLKQQLEEFFNMKQRQMDMPVILDSQAPSQIPNPSSNSQYNFLGKLSEVFLGCDQTGRPLGQSEWRKVLKSMNMLTRSNKADWRRRIKRLNRFEFLYVSPKKHDGPRDCPTVKSLAPLVSHPS